MSVKTESGNQIQYMLMFNDARNFNKTTKIRWKLRADVESENYIQFLEINFAYGFTCIFDWNNWKYTLDSVEIAIRQAQAKSIQLENIE